MRCNTESDFNRAAAFVLIMKRATQEIQHVISLDAAELPANIGPYLANSDTSTIIAQTLSSNTSGLVTPQSIFTYSGSGGELNVSSQT